MEIISKEDKEMLKSLWETINDPKYYELRDKAWQLIDFLQRVERAECGFPAAPVPAPSGYWIDSTPNEEWQKSVRYI